ncbi:helix-turn-helix domain-containing protein [Streptomyces sp. WAC 06725]|uniref:helix-turn-helix domain-containing protein n=1 Tax=Streptomyces sp. WAC 06725 TaxID=2203209 RepID=UPI0037D9974F
MGRRRKPKDLDEPLAAFAHALERLCNAAGDARSIDEIAAEAGLGRNTVYEALGGKRLPSRHTVAALARIWEADVADLLERRSEAERAACEPAPAHMQRRPPTIYGLGAIQEKVDFGPPAPCADSQRPKDFETAEEAAIAAHREFQRHISWWHSHVKDIYDLEVIARIAQRTPYQVSDVLSGEYYHNDRGKVLETRCSIVRALEVYPAPGLGLPPRRFSKICQHWALEAYTREGHVSTVRTALCEEGHSPPLPKLYCIVK